MKLYVMIGIPGSGKTTWCKQHLKERDTYVSTDDIREELLGDAGLQKDAKTVFATAYKRISEAPGDVYFDATNISRRRKLFKMFGKKFDMIAVYFPCSVETAVERQNYRERKVPTEVIERMHKKLAYTYPCIGEGFKEVIIVKDGKEVSVHV